VARLRHRGHKLEEIREATKQGRLAYGFLEDMFPDSQGTRTLEDAVEATGLQPALIERFWTSLGLPGQGLENLTDDDIQALQYAASVLASGFPLVAFLQLARVYGQALARIADAEVRLFHIYVHEPLIREGLPGLQMAEEMEHLARDLLPLASPLMDFVHQRFLSHYIEQDVVGHMEIEMDPDASASTTAQRCTATATTSGGRSTWPPGSSRARGGDVLVSDAVVERVAESEHLVFQGVGQVKLKGFNETVQLCRAQTPEGQ